jgi:hypothetical protein
MLATSFAAKSDKLQFVVAALRRAKSVSDIKQEARVREAISLAPRLQPGEAKLELTRETVSNDLLVAVGTGETVGNGSGKSFVEPDHRAEATVLMRSLRVPCLLSNLRSRF